MRRRENGFTLIELLMAMTFFSFVLLMISTGFIQVLRIYQSAVITKNAQNTSRSIFETISRDIREGDSVFVSVDNQDCINIGNYHYRRTTNNQLWRIPNSGFIATNICTANPATIAGAHLMHEDNLSVYNMSSQAVRGSSDPNASARSLQISLVVGVLSSSGDLVDFSDPENVRCVTDPTALRLCSVVELNSSISMRGGS